MKRYIKLGVIIVVSWIAGGILQTSDLPFWRDIVGSTLLWGSGAAFALVLIQPTTGGEGDDDVG